MPLAPPPVPSSDASTRSSPGAGYEHHLFRFGLRQFFGFVSAIAVLLGVMAMIRGGWAVGLAFLASLAAAHVLATFVGTRLRDSSSEVHRWAAERFGDRGEANPARRRLSPAELAALTATPLAKHERAPLRTVLAAIGGLAVGGFMGAAGVPLIAGPEATGAGIALGAASCAVMGAWMALLAAHFWSVMRRTWRDASGSEGKRRAKPRAAEGAPRPALSQGEKAT